jgi:DNA-binding response OmpR family regulator
MIEQPTALIVESDRLTRESLARRLCLAGYSATELCHPRQALAATSERCYDIAVLACELPEIDGLTLMEQLHRRGGVHDCVIITRDETDLDVHAALDRGAFAVLTWSRVPQELTATVNHALEGAKIPHQAVEVA